MKEISGHVFGLPGQLMQKSIVRAGTAKLENKIKSSSQILSISVNNKDILKFSKVIEVFFHAVLTNFYPQKIVLIESSWSKLLVSR